MNFFEEKQKFNQIWLWVLLMCSTLSALVPVSIGFYQQLVLSKPFGNEPMSDTAFVFFFVFVLTVLAAVILLIYSMKFETKVDKFGFQYKFFPFIRSWRTIRKEDIDHFEIKRYNALIDFGGWGYRINWKGTKAMNIKGNDGMKMLTKGKSYLFGTQKPEELKRAMDKLMSSPKEY